MTLLRIVTNNFMPIPGSITWVTLKHNILKN